MLIFDGLCVTSVFLPGSKFLLSSNMTEILDISEYSNMTENFDISENSASNVTENFDISGNSASNMTDYLNISVNSIRDTLSHVEDVGDLTPVYLLIGGVTAAR